MLDALKLFCASWVCLFKDWFESYRLHGACIGTKSKHANHPYFGDSRDTKNDSIFGARREKQRRRRHAPSCMGATELQSNWPDMRKTLETPEFCSGEDRNRTLNCFPNGFEEFERHQGGIENSYNYSEKSP